MKHHRLCALLMGLIVWVGSGAARAADKEIIKVGTLAPKSSPWGKVYETWIKAVSDKSSGKLELQFFYNGVQGDEDSMVGKIKSGQLDGAAISGVGLSKVYNPILALQMPGLFTSWSKLDKARDAMKGEFGKGAKVSARTMDCSAARTLFCSKTTPGPKIGAVLSQSRAGSFRVLSHP